jgi:hypothetical protein
MNMNFKPRMAQTVTRSESYSALDQAILIIIVKKNIIIIS